MKSDVPTPEQSPSSSTTTVEDTTLHPTAPLAKPARRGFADMDPAKQRLLAAAGGRASHSSGRAHQWTKEEAREAGRKGGEISRRGPKPKTKEQ